MTELKLRVKLLFLMDGLKLWFNETWSRPGSRGFDVCSVVRLPIVTREGFAFM